MGLNIGATGNGKPYCKYSSKADKWIFRAADGREWEIQRPVCVIDFDNIATGWLRFSEGEVPERVMDTTLKRRAPLPGDGFKRGFVVTVFSLKYFGGLAELASNSMHLSNAIKEIYAQYAQRPKGQSRQAACDCLYRFKSDGETATALIIGRLSR